MKKVFAICAVALFAVSFSSCKKDCCTLSGAEICEDDLPAAYDNWDDYKDFVEAAGGSCD